MSVTLVRPPPPVSVGARGGGRKWYTLHSHTNNVFAWTFDNRVKTSTVVFARHQDASFMARMIEAYVIREKQWPAVSTLDNVFRVYGAGLVQTEEEGFIEIKSWELDDLRIFCVESYLDMITLKKLTRKNNDTFVVSGDLISLDVPTAFYVERLNYLVGI